MGLKITLKPFERIEIGPVTVVNGWIDTSTFLIEGPAPVLRQANSLRDDEADTLLKQIYLCVQKLFLRREGATMTQYHELTGQLLMEMPAAADAVDAAGRDIVEGRHFAALRRYRELIETTEAEDKRHSATTGESTRGTRAAPIVHFVRDRRRYRLGSAGAQSAQLRQ